MFRTSIWKEKASTFQKIIFQNPTDYWFFSNLLYKILDQMHSLFPITFCFSMQPLQISNYILTKTAQKLEKNSQDRKQAICVNYYYYYFY